VSDALQDSLARKNWKAYVRQRLGGLNLSPECEEDVITELAGHLEDRLAAAVHKGVAEPEATAMALEEVPDWVALNHEISAAKKEGPMNERAKYLWIPGMTMLISAFLLLTAIARLVPPVAWTHQGAPLYFFAPWLVTYAVFGAVGAHWSRRAGGSVTMRFLAGIFPVAMHLVIFICVFIAANVQSHPRTPEWLDPSFLVKVFLTFVLLPGIALAVGALPFLGNRARESAPSRA
jgi:hypothetical protein